MPEPSRDYWSALEDCKRHHASSKTYSGRLMRPHAAFIKEIIDRLECRSALDFGAGKGGQYEWVMPNRGITIEQWWGIPVTKYDPAWPAYAAEPTGRYDIVIVTHTLGAIPSSDLKWVVDRLYALAGKAIYVAEKIGETKKRVVADRSVCPMGATPEFWRDALRRDSEVEVTLATKSSESGVIEHHRLGKYGWHRVTWPMHVRALDHTWA